VCVIPASVVVGPALVAIAVNERELESRLANYAICCWEQDMGHLGSNQYVLEEVFAASVTEAFEHLKQIGSLYPLSPFTASLEGLTQHAFGVGSKWREHRRHLFLRDVMECEVVQCAAPSSFSIASNDGEAAQGSIQCGH